MPLPAIAMALLLPVTVTAALHAAEEPVGPAAVFAGLKTPIGEWEGKAGNQPRMQARGFDEKTGILRFEYLDATNLASRAAGHMRNVTLRLDDGGATSALRGSPKKTAGRR